MSNERWKSLGNDPTPSLAAVRGMVGMAAGLLTVALSHSTWKMDRGSRPSCICKLPCPRLCGLPGDAPAVCLQHQDELCIGGVWQVDRDGRLSTEALLRASQSHHIKTFPRAPLLPVRRGAESLCPVCPCRCRQHLPRIARECRSSQRGDLRAMLGRQSSPGTGEKTKTKTNQARKRGWFLGGYPGWVLGHTRPLCYL